MPVTPASTRRIVIADNDPEVIDLLVTDLEAEGHEIVGTATSGADALELCRRLLPDVLIVDFRMPGGPDGLEVARRIGDDGLGIEVVVYTNYRRPDLERRATRAGATYLAKGNIRALRRAISGRPAG